jgi:lysophospholipase L1-like esterase
VALPITMVTVYALDAAALGVTEAVLAGHVTFTPSVKTLVNSTGGESTIMLAAAYAATLDDRGGFSLDLPATDDPAVASAGWHYTMVLHATGHAPRRWTVQVPYDSAGGTLDVTTAMAVETPAGLESYVTGADVAAAQAAAEAHADQAVATLSDSVDATYVRVGEELAERLEKAQNLADLADAAAARTHLGLGGAAVLDVGTTAGTVADGAALKAHMEATTGAHGIPDPATIVVDSDLGDAAAKDVGTTSGTVAAGDHGHDGIPVIADTSTVKIGGYVPAANVTAQWGNAGTDFYAISIERRTRIRAAGALTEIELYVAATAGVTALYFQVWRKNSSGTFDRVFQEDILSKVTYGGVNRVRLNSPAEVQLGDYIGYGATGTPVVKVFKCAADGVGTASSYYTITDTPTATGYNWAGKTSSAAGYVPVVCYGSAPMVVCIGDSITAGVPAGGSFLVGADGDPTPASNYAYWLHKMTGWNCQNMGVGGQESTLIYARFANDAVAINPRIVVINGGVNDLGHGVAESYYIGRMTSILNAATAAGILPVVLGITPMTSQSNELLQTRDVWNVSLAALVATYPKAIFVDVGARVGKFRAGGNVGNLWDIIPEYDADGIHFTVAGYQQIACAILDAIRLRM